MSTPAVAVHDGRHLSAMVLGCACFRVKNFRRFQKFSKNRVRSVLLLPRASQHLWPCFERAVPGRPLRSEGEGPTLICVAWYPSRESFPGLVYRFWSSFHVRSLSVFQRIAPGMFCHRGTTTAGSLRCLTAVPPLSSLRVAMLQYADRLSLGPPPRTLQ